MTVFRIWEEVKIVNPHPLPFGHLPLHALHGEGACVKKRPSFSLREKVPEGRMRVRLPRRKQRAFVAIINNISEHPRFSSPAWQTVFARKYATPAKLLAAVAPLLADLVETHCNSSPPSKIEIINHYLRLHPKRAQLFAWKNTAGACALAQYSPAWHKFFATDFKTPQELMAAIGDE